MMRDQLMFVQFPHPGPEHRPPGVRMEWTPITRDHARKFMKASAEHLAGDEVGTGAVTFWGEWEPPSIVLETHPSSRDGLPRWVHEPVLRVPGSLQGLQNTDPLVFGDRFLYSNCRQTRNGKLLALAPGSVIVFGSDLAGDFVVDTVMVVGERSTPYVESNASSVGTDAWVRDVVFNPLEANVKKQDARLRAYWGRMHDDHPALPFSFVPCRPFDEGDYRFARPPLRLRGRVTAGLRQGAKATSATRSELTDLWREVVRQTIELPGLQMGVKLNPPRIEETPHAV